MSAIVLDASVVGKLLFPERYTQEAESLYEDAVANNRTIAAPSLLRFEVTNIIRKQMRARRLSLAYASAVLNRFLAFPIALYQYDGLHHEALALAAAHSLGAADAHYVALAQMLGCDLWVDDTRLLRAVHGRVPFVRFVGDYVPGSI